MKKFNYIYFLIALLILMVAWPLSWLFRTSEPKTEPLPPPPALVEPTQAQTETPKEIPIQNVVVKAPEEIPAKVPTEIPTEVSIESPTKAPTEIPKEVSTKSPTKAPVQAQVAPKKTHPTATVSKTSHPVTEGSNKWVNNQVHILKAQASNIDDQALRTSLIAYVNARKQGLDSKQMLTVIDFSKPSSQKRLWVFDLKTDRTLFNTWVAHGKNSGGTNSTSFSNTPGSLKSSIGVFLTEDPYIGNKGIALHLKGLEHGVNDNAYSRSVVIHGAWYANPDIIKRYGQLGRSWGCPAVGSNLARPLINTIKENTLLVAYYPDRRWLSHSPFLAG